jgi:hypothetical protein
MITNHDLDNGFHVAAFSKFGNLKHNKRWKASLRLLKGFTNKLVLFICLESVLAGLILFGTGYIAVLS